MKRFAFPGILAVLLLAGLLFVNHQRQQTPAYLLRQYPRTQTFQTIERNHLQRQLPSILTDGFRSSGVTDAIFYITWFDGPQHIPSQQAVNSAERLAAIFGGAMPQQVLHSIHYSRLAPARMAVLKRTLAQMPPNDAPSSLDRLLLMSFQDGPTWTTRLYDRAHLPAKVAHIFPLATKPEGWPHGAFKP